MEFIEELLSLLKEQAKKAKTGISDSSFKESASYRRASYVQTSHIDNLCLTEEEFAKYKAYFDKGNGKELKKRANWGNNCKMQSLRSSAAMIVNILGRKENEKLIIKENKLGIPEGEYEVSFERKFRTLIASEKYPAHVDALLLSKDGRTAILIESKMFEYLEGSKKKEKGKKNFSSTYLKPQSYYVKGEQFAKAIEECNDVADSFDYPQLIKHILGFYNALSSPAECFFHYEDNNEDLSHVDKVILLNVVWRMKEREDASPLYKRFRKKWDAEEKAAQTLLPKIQESLEGIVKDRFALKLAFLPFDELISIVNDEERAAYLERYYI